MDLSPLLEFYADIPADLGDYFDKVEQQQLFQKSGTQSGLLSPDRVAKVTNEFRTFHPLVAGLELLLLDESGTSNYHCYVPDMPVAGSVLYLSHDARNRLVFQSLNEFLTAHATPDGHTEDYHAKGLFPGDDADALNRRIEELYCHSEQFDFDVEPVILVLIESSNLRDVELFTALVKDDNFYYGEAIADRITADPKPWMDSIARKCLEHPHPQVSRHGQIAVNAVATSAAS